MDGEYKGRLRRLIVEVDNVSVLKRLRKERCFCGEEEQLERKRGRRLEKSGWEIILEWVPGHVGMEESKAGDKLVKEKEWEEEDEVVGVVLSWESRRVRGEG